MSNKNISMMKLKRIIQMLSEGKSLNVICKETHSSKTTVSNYKKLAECTKLPYVELLQKSDSELERLLFSQLSQPAADSRKAALLEMMPEIARRLGKRYANVQLVYEEYYLKQPGGHYGYTQFKSHVQSYLEAHSYSYHNTYTPGEEWQIDFAGDALYLTDRETGGLTKLTVLVCVMPYSELPFLMALPNATTEWFFLGLNKGLEHMGALPRIAKSDNMRQWVTKSDRYSPSLADACMEWGLYYGIQPTACRVRKPRDKGPVESSVNQLYTYVYARVQDEVFHDINTLNGRLWELLDEYCSKPYKGSTRWEIFKNEELPNMAPLPQAMHRFRYRKEVKLGSTYHVCVGSERHFYSVPHKYVGQKVRVMWDTSLVEVYCGSEFVCSHPRSLKPYAYSTKKEHMPEAHKAYERSKEQNASTLLQRASFIGVSTQWAVDTMLRKTRFPQQAYGNCNALLALVGRYGKSRVEKACRMMRTETSSASLQVARNILTNNRDLAADNGEIVSQVPKNDNVRGAEEYSALLETNKANAGQGKEGQA